MNEKGVFITFEGCEGVGKSTHAKRLAAMLADRGAVFTREPGGTPVAEKIREILISDTLTVSPEIEAELFAVQRREHADNLILPALRSGKTVVCDRYIDSSIAYQGFARGIGIDRVLELNEYIVKNCMPDVTLFFDMAPSESFRRRKGSVVEHDRFEGEKLEFHMACYAGFKEAARRFPQRIVSIIPDNDKEVTFYRVVSALKERGIL